MSFRNRIYLSFCKEKLLNNMLSLTSPCELQSKMFNLLITNGKDTKFGEEHGFRLIQGDINRFRKSVPIRDYNSFFKYIQRIREGEDYVTWNQKVKWFAKSSGTSSDKSKYIPITPLSLRMNHYGGFNSMMAGYISNNPNSRIFNGKALTLGGSVAPDIFNGKYSGDLSAILLQNSPRLAELFRVPNRETALLSNFNQKIKAIAKECSKRNVTSFAGVPSWNLMLMNEVLSYTGRSNLLEVWPDIELFMHGGIGFEPYRNIFNKLFPSSQMRYIESYNASEGYFAFQDDLSVNTLSFCCGIGVFYEFVKMEHLTKAMKESDNQGSENRGYEFYDLPSCSLAEVEMGVNYALVISTVGGLWRYLIGDTVMFTQLNPHRFKITGRTKLCINAFGEELMIDNAEKAVVEACKKHNINVIDFTVAPVYMQLKECTTKGAHRWVIEFENQPADLESFADTLDKELTLQNSDYDAKRKDNATMGRLQLTAVPKGTFFRWMESRGKAGGQNKVPRLSTSDTYIKELLSIADNR